MGDTLQLAENVSGFLDNAAIAYGRIKQREFSEEMYCQLVDQEIQSPIEQIFFIALNVICAEERIDVDPEPLFFNGKWRVGYGVHVRPQAKIGKYRVDFLIGNDQINESTALIVELDGHSFHDKDKVQRAYEKRRDRFFVSSGYRVLHYTGSEVVKDPYRVATEVLTVLGAIGVD